MKCEYCKKEYPKYRLGTIGEKYIEDGLIYGRFIYSCKNCFDMNVNIFKNTRKENSELIIRPPLEDI